MLAGGVVQNGTTKFLNLHVQSAPDNRDAYIGFRVFKIRGTFKAGYRRFLEHVGGHIGFSALGFSKIRVPFSVVSLDLPVIQIINFNPSLGLY